MTDPTATPLLIAAPIVPDAMLEALSGIGPTRRYDGNPATLAGARVYVSTALDAVPADLIGAMPGELRLIANIGVGTDNIDLAAAAARDLQVSNTPVVTEDTADLAMALLLAACRRTTHAERLLRDGRFPEAQRHLGVRVHGKTLGIVGFGAIGQALARRAAAFGMSLLYHGPRPKPGAEQDTGARYCSELADLLAAADIVSLNCPLNDDTHHLVNAATLAQMKPGAILVNTARGPLVDERALVEALARGHLGGAGLDVFEFEPQVTQELLVLDNVTLLPHIGSATGECRQDMAMRVIANIRAFLETGRVLDPCS